MKSLILAEKPSVARDIAEAMNIKENVMDILKTKVCCHMGIGSFSH